MLKRLKALALSVVLFLAAIAPALADHMPGYAHKFAEVFMESVAAAGDDPKMCKVEYIGGNEKDGYIVTVECVTRPFKCALHVLPETMAVVDCISNPNFKPGTKI